MSDDSKNACFLRGEKLYQSVVGDGACDVHALVGQLLIGLGFKSKLIGTQFLKDAIVYRYQKSDVAHVSYNNDVYLQVANKLHSTVCRVERAIRNTINDCAEFGNLNAFDDLTHGRLTENGYVPSNTELISSIVGWLEIEKDKGHIKE